MARRRNDAAVAIQRQARGMMERSAVISLVQARQAAAEDAEDDDDSR